MSIVITGVAGFVGVNLAREILAKGTRIVGIDNLSRGTPENLAEFRDSDLLSFEHVDICEYDRFFDVLQRAHAHEPITEVWHLAANSDIPAGVSNANVDLKDTFMTTFHTLEAMKALEIPVLAFASSSAVYGDFNGIPIHEDIGPLLPISNYGAMKLASEAIICAAAESYLERAYLFRFPNVIGVPATHGVVYDFIGKLRRDPLRLQVLGDGTQQKSYLHVSDLVDAMLYVREHSRDKVNYFNIGSDDEGITVRFIAEEVVSVAAPDAQILYGEGNRGWVGDVPSFRYSIDKLRALGWKPRWDSAESMRMAIRQINAQEGF